MIRSAALVCVATFSSASFAAITGSNDATGMMLINRLFENSGVPVSAVNPNNVDYVGLVNAGSQGGVFDSLVLAGASGTSQTLGQGIVLSSGLVTGVPSSNTVGWYSNATNSGSSNFFRDFPANTGSPRHSGRLQERDTNAITFDIEVPEGVVGVQADFVYASEEFPEWAGTMFADGFAFIVDDVNYAKLPDGRPVSLCSQNDNVHFMINGDWSDASVAQVNPIEYDGMTRVLELTAPLNPGHRQTITIVVADTGDQIYDSAAFVSSLRFITGDAPIDPNDCHVRVRHRSSDDDSYQELNLPGAQCDSIDFNNDTSMFDPADIDAFLSVYGEGPCIPATAVCNDIDFNNDGSVFDPCDIDSFLASFSEGPCTPCGQ
ncbi:MAG: choice-of-anchor L domain-containing protein [Phycisphaerales bacterium]